MGERVAVRLYEWCSNREGRVEAIGGAPRGCQVHTEERRQYATHPAV